MSKEVILAAVLFGTSISADPIPEIQESHELLKSSRVGLLDFKGTKFSEAFSWLEAKWKESHSNRDFPVAITEFEFDFPHGDHETLVTLKLKNPTFWEALDFIASSSRRSLRSEKGLVQLEYAYQTVADNPWWPELHGPSKETLRILGIGPGSSAKEIHAAYSKYDIEFDDWMPAEIDELGWLTLTAKRSEHHKIQGLHHLLESGFSITRGKNSKSTDQPEN